MLKILILKRQLDAKRSELKALEEKDAEFQTREADLETAIGEVEPGNAEQEAAVTAEVDAFEARLPTRLPSRPCLRTLNTWRPSWRTWSARPRLPRPRKSGRK